jgi:ABC-type sugar transport system substrate-binding protein
MKKMFLISMVVLIGLSMIGCSKETSKEGKGLVFGMDAGFLSHEFYQRCIQGMEKKCAEIGATLVVADGNNDPNEQLNIAQQFITNGVNAILLSPTDPTACKAIVLAANKANIPVITESDRVEGAKTLVGADTYVAGIEIGEWIGNYLKNNNIEGTVLIVGLPGLPNIASLERGFKEGMTNSGATFNIVAETDGQGMKEVSMQVALDALTANPDINVIFGINDDSILGAIQAYKTLNRDPATMVTGTFGLEGNAGAKAMMEENTLTMAMGYMPEYYGYKMIEAAHKAVMGEQLPDFYPSPVRIVSKDNFYDFYTKVGDNYVLNIEAVAALDK